MPLYHIHINKGEIKKNAKYDPVEVQNKKQQLRKVGHNDAIIWKAYFWTRSIWVLGSGFAGKEVSG